MRAATDLSQFLFIILASHVKRDGTYKAAHPRRLGWYYTNTARLLPHPIAPLCPSMCTSCLPVLC